MATWSVPRDASSEPRPVAGVAAWAVDVAVAPIAFVRLMTPLPFTIWNWNVLVAVAVSNAFT